MSNEERDVIREAQTERSGQMGAHGRRGHKVDAWEESKVVKMGMDEDACIGSPMRRVPRVRCAHVT